MRPEDVFAPSYREYGAQFMRGVQPREVLMYWGGDERGNDFQGPKNDYPWCVPIATQCLMAAGAALSFKLRKQDRLAVACCGDGGSSKRSEEHTSELPSLTRHTHDVYCLK